MILVPMKPQTEADVPTFLAGCNTVLDQLAPTPGRSRDQDWNRVGIEMHGKLEEIAKTWPDAKKLPAFYNTIKRLLKNVFDLDYDTLPKPGTPRFHFDVWVDCATEAEAKRVMTERLGPDEDYGFDYTVDWKSNP